MKKLNVFLGLSVLSMALFFTACSDENAIGPSLQITSGEVDSVAANGTVTITWRADAGDAKLKTFTITNELGSAVAGWDAIDIDNADNETYVGTADVTVGDEDTYFNLVVTDNDGLDATAKVTIYIDVNAPVGEPINEYTNKILGGQGNNDIGSSFASIDGSIYSWTNAVANSAKVDWLYFYGTTNLATIAAPDDADAVTAFSAVGDLNAWATNNATRFKKVNLGSTTWDEITTDLKIVELATGLTSSKINSLAAGDIIAFEAASSSSNAGKKGLIKVVSITGTSGTDRAITTEVKVQE